MDNNLIIAKHLCGNNEAITEELYEHFNTSDSWKIGKGKGSIVQNTLESADLQVLCEANGVSAIATGCGTHANSNYSSAEGLISMTLDTGQYPGWMDGVAAHAEGNQTTAGGRASHAEGDGTTTNNIGEHAEGRYNISHFVTNEWGNPGNTIHSVGIGSPSQSLYFENSKNAFEIMQNGDAYLIGIGGYDGTNPTIATRLQDIIGGGSTGGLITIVKDLGLTYTGTEFMTAIIGTPELAAYKAEPYKYNLIIEVHGRHEDSGELYGYTANHFCYMTNNDGTFAAMCHDTVNEGISHDTQFGYGENGWFVTYSGFFDGTGGQALPEVGSKVSIYLQQF